ncbi:hypothetical protein BST81_07235 [Leptolyngbya sp. 'hensonii']|nr:hypothetical protein [Leptolyngbya sp. 'hensonii']OLP19010.1 hypothetical protein BST81_07235 [Leptolyngbya sp. 'hensonii']
MNQDQLPGDRRAPAPCIVDTGIVVNKRDMQSILGDLGCVRYIYRQNNELLSQGEGLVLDVFADPSRSTVVANHSLYLNVLSFDYLELKVSPEAQTCLDLVQDNLCLQLIPLSNPLQEQVTCNLNAAALDAVVTEVLSASWDVPIEDGGSPI